MCKSYANFQTKGLFIYISPLTGLAQLVQQNLPSIHMGKFQPGYCSYGKFQLGYQDEQGATFQVSSQ